MADLKYPRLWRHKKTKKQYRVMPWWEIPDPIMTPEEWTEMTRDENPKVKIGALVQIGYLLENEHGVWFGFNLTVAKQFKDLGEAKKK